MCPSLCPHREFDRETTARYTFDVAASDGGQYGPRSRRVRVTVHVADVNDNAPVFAQIPYTASIAAAHGARQYVVQASATDRDAGLNAQVAYSLATPTPYFEINRDTGTIVTKAALDAAAVRVHTLHVVARDRGRPPRSARGEPALS